MADAPLPERVEIRYVAGISASTEGIVTDVVLLVEDEAGNRVAGPTFVITGMTPKQVQHLHMQLDNVLRIVGAPPLLPDPPTVEEWAATARAERQHASDKGYTTEHDRAHGIRHVLNWAIDYGRRGYPEASSGLILAAMELLPPEPEGSTDGR